MSITNVSEWFDGAERVLFVHAHPDDETIVTGGVIAGLHENDRRPFVVTLTRGEQGEIRPEAVKAEVSLTETRVAEIACAMQKLGGVDHAFLGSLPARKPGLKELVYEDSGMSWVAEGVAGPSASSGPAAITKVPAVWALDDLVTLALEIDAGAIVSYDANGGYGHPDHVLANKLARAVALACEIPFYEIVENEGETYDTTDWFDKKIAALKCYETQIEVQNESQILHVGGQLQPIGVLESFALRNAF